MPEIRETVCNRDCPDACSVVAHVEDGRVLQLGGDPSHPVTQGFLCWRTNNFLPLQYSPDRLTTPLLRGKAVSWDEALDFAARELLRIRAESGPAAIFHYRSGGSLGALKHLSDYFFEKLGPVAIKRGDICSGAGDAAQLLDFGEFRAMAFAQSVAGWCEDADVAPAAAEDLARRLHEGPTAILVGWGMGRRVNGGSTIRALDALGTISGNIGVPGGGVSYYFK